MELTQLQEVTRRTDVVSYALLAEINHFHSERIVDFTKAMRNFLSEQINFYSKVCNIYFIFIIHTQNLYII